MTPIYNDFSIHIATQNGSGSQSANNILVRSLFRMGLPVAGKNLFPSNIQGLPTWFTIRVNKDQHLCRAKQFDILVAMNPDSFEKDIEQAHPGSVFIYNNQIKFDQNLLKDNLILIPVPFKDLSKKTSDSIKLRKLLINMVYLGVLSDLLDIPIAIVENTIQDQFLGKESVIQSNLDAFHAGRNYSVLNFQEVKQKLPFKTQPIENGNQGKVLIDGNTAASLGLIYGGCNFVAWYPITPSSSLAEGYEYYAKILKRDHEGKNTFAIIQAEDELASISMVMGAGWAGARAMTCTSGPGLSLMSEAAGLSYFAEVPTVIWDVQRGGPSTGLPTRTQQCDVLSAATLSHGDTEHVLLFPANPKECFEFGKTCFDLAEQLQTLVIVLSDLDIGMNFWITDDFTPSTEPLKRGKVLDKNQLESLGEFKRYFDKDGDGIPYRTLPGTESSLGAYFTRGTGHDETSNYSEDNEIYKSTLNRLKKKFETAKQLVPKPIITKNKNIKIGLIAYGSTDASIKEAQYLLEKEHIKTNYLRLRAYPFTKEIENFLAEHDEVYLIEQNRDAQLKTLLLKEFPQHYKKVCSVLQYDGLPITAQHINDEVQFIKGGL